MVRDLKRQLSPNIINILLESQTQIHEDAYTTSNTSTTYYLRIETNTVDMQSLIDVVKFGGATVLAELGRLYFGRFHQQIFTG